jgi:nitrogen regulatory protein P-II 1
MQLIVAILQPTKLAVVREQLLQIGVEKMTVCDALGFGRQRGQTATYRGVEYRADLLRKVCVEIVVNDDFLEPTLAVLQKAARRGSVGEIGDGKVFVMPVVDAYDLASPASGPGAV